MGWMNVNGTRNFFISTISSFGNFWWFSGRISKTEKPEIKLASNIDSHHFFLPNKLLISCLLCLIGVSIEVHNCPIVINTAHREENLQDFLLEIWVVPSRYLSSSFNNPTWCWKIRQILQGFKLANIKPYDVVQSLKSKTFW